ncbi:S-adenosylmethionine:tRNA ribosyltransferase-isomerase [hydrothermal vent metagenome]|uniref:S-adenosylmethionine:tRNA ribosyltransferase-isomerase n=1 Tax=hydrothermal vent metagenome TaxID=652676 RepID=A0A160TRR6_9ZZZZ
MLLENFEYDLPKELIAQEPLHGRSDSRLLTVTREGRLTDKHVRDLPGLLEPGDLLVFNDTRVFKARLSAVKADSGGRVEIVVERLLGPSCCLAIIRSSNPVRDGSELLTSSGYRLQVQSRTSDFYQLIALAGAVFDKILSADGSLPLPPYIRRQPNLQDYDRYQTVFAAESGAVAAPTAGLHFDVGLMDRLEAAGVKIDFLTLHVGSGTFQPVRSKVIEDHRMHKEWLKVDEVLVSAVNRTRRNGNRVVGVGTTVVRALETASQNGQLVPFEGETDLYIYPGYRFQTVDALLTNFHLPRSSLLIMVSAFSGVERIREVYEHALKQRYRFFSYGDCMILNRAEHLNEV